MAVPGVLVWFVLLVVGRILSMPQAGAIVPLVLLTAAAVVMPFVGWSAGWPDDHLTASVVALGAGLALAAVTLVVARRSRGWDSPPGQSLPTSGEPSKSTTE